MLRNIFLTIVSLAIAIGVGAGSAWYSLESGFGFGSVRIGAWVAHPERGTPAADPYTKARFSREADLALGHAEGMVFTASRDGEGEPLRYDCTYRVEGALPPARFWTLLARDARGAVIVAPGGRAAALHSLELLRQPDNTVSTTISRYPSPGNWLAVQGRGTFSLDLTLYDTAIASSARISEVELPRVEQVSCDG